MGAIAYAVWNKCMDAQNNKLPVIQHVKVVSITSSIVMWAPKKGRRENQRYFYLTKV